MNGKTKTNLLEEIRQIDDSIHSLRFRLTKIKNKKKFEKQFDDIEFVILRYEDFRNKLLKRINELPYVDSDTSSTNVVDQGVMGSQSEFPKPSGYWMTFLLLPGKAKAVIVELDDCYENFWLVRFGAKRARRTYHWQSIITVLSVWCAPLWRIVDRARKISLFG